LDLRAVAVTELLGDLLDQAKRLNAEGYRVAAASLAGAVLEDALRRLCRARGLSIPAKTDIARLNAELAEAGAYDAPTQRRITALAEIRDRAHRGHPDKVRREDVEEMVKWVRRFAFHHLRKGWSG